MSPSPTSRSPVSPRPQCRQKCRPQCRRPQWPRPEWRSFFIPIVVVQILDRKKCPKSQPFDNWNPNAFGFRPSNVITNIFNEVDTITSMKYIADDLMESLLERFITTSLVARLDSKSPLSLIISVPVWFSFSSLSPQVSEIQTCLRSKLFRVWFSDRWISNVRD